MSTPRLRRGASLSLSLAAALAAAVAAPAAFALKSDRDQPLNVSSNTFRTDQQKHLTVLTGAVKLDQGSIKGESDKGTVHQNDDNEIVRVVLEGKPARLDQKLDGDGGMMRSSAANIDYDNQKSVAVLTGNAVVIQEGRGTFKAEKIVYNTESGEITGGVEGGGRVTMTALPQPKKAATDKPADAKPATDKKP
jgi:lipopolysaccharide export system protein LptA